MAEVFFSYSHADRSRAAAVAGAVEESGLSLWWDAKLRPGCLYGQAIEAEIAEAGCVLVAWSKAARESLWVRAEANEALDQGKLVQLSLDGARRPLPFGALPIVDLRDWKGGTGTAPWPEAQARLRAMLGGKGPEATPMWEPALHGFGQAATVGWAAIALALLTGTAIGAAASGAMNAAVFGLAAFYAVAAAPLLLAGAAWRAVRVLRASRR